MSEQAPASTSRRVVARVRAYLALCVVGLIAAGGVVETVAEAATGDAPAAGRTERLAARDACAPSLLGGDSTGGVFAALWADDATGSLPPRSTRGPHDRRRSPRTYGHSAGASSSRARVPLFALYYLVTARVVAAVSR